MHTGTLIDNGSFLLLIGIIFRVVVLILMSRLRADSTPSTWSFRIDREKQDGSRTRISISSHTGSTVESRSPRQRSVMKTCRTTVASEQKLRLPRSK